MKNELNFREDVAYFCLPDFYKLYDMYETLFLLAQNHPEAFRNNCQILSIYGNFPGVEWNGGRPYYGEKLSLPVIEEFLKNYKRNHWGIPLTLTFTNTEPELDDYYCNVLAEMVDKYGHRVMVSSKALRDYLRETYPNLIIGKSIIGNRYGSDIEDLKNYDFIVPDKSHTWPWLYDKEITKEQKQRIELMANDKCCDKCPVFYQHHFHVAMQQKGIIAKEDNFQCPNQTDFPLRAAATNKWNIQPGQIGEFVRNGFQCFKLTGRENPYFVIQGIVKYLVEPEYQDDITLHLLEAVYG